MKQHSLAKNAHLFDVWKVWPSPLSMEIGFGFGDHLRGWIAQNPRDFMLGVEMFDNGVAHLAHHLSPEDHARVRIIHDNIHTVLPTLPSAIFHHIFILFPDPWMKKRHHKRRLIQQNFLTECNRLLCEEGKIIVATDKTELMKWTLEKLNIHTSFIWQEGAQRDDMHHALPKHWMPSRYQQKALQRGGEAFFTVWKKV